MYSIIYLSILPFNGCNLLPVSAYRCDVFVLFLLIANCWLRKETSVVLVCLNGLYPRAAGMLEWLVHVRLDVYCCQTPKTRAKVKMIDWYRIALFSSILCCCGTIYITFCLLYYFIFCLSFSIFGWFFLASLSIHLCYAWAEVFSTQKYYWILSLYYCWVEIYLKRHIILYYLDYYLFGYVVILATCFTLSSCNNPEAFISWFLKCLFICFNK